MRAAQFGARLVVPGSSEWPASLDDWGPRRPLALWVAGSGDLARLGRRAVVVVGARALDDVSLRVLDALPVRQYAGPASLARVAGLDFSTVLRGLAVLAVQSLAESRDGGWRRGVAPGEWPLTKRATGPQRDRSTWSRRPLDIPAVPATRRPVFATVGR
jgi:hypothetical protein